MLQSVIMGDEVVRQHLAGNDNKGPAPAQQACNDFSADAASGRQDPRNDVTGDQRLAQSPVWCSCQLVHRGTHSIVIHTRT